MIAGRKLLELVHVTYLHIQAFGKLVAKTDEEAVLIKYIVSNLLACIDMHFIVECKEQRIRLDEIPVQGHH